MRPRLLLQPVAGVADGDVVAAVGVAVVPERYQQIPAAHPHLQSRTEPHALGPPEVVLRRTDCSADDRSRRAVSRDRNCCRVQSYVRVASRVPASFQLVAPVGLLSLNVNLSSREEGSMPSFPVALNNQNRPYMSRHQIHTTHQFLSSRNASFKFQTSDTIYTLFKVEQAQTRRPINYRLPRARITKCHKTTDHYSLLVFFFVYSHARVILLVGGCDNSSLEGNRALDNRHESDIGLGWVRRALLKICYWGKSCDSLSRFLLEPKVVGRGSRWSALD